MELNEVKSACRPGSVGVRFYPCAVAVIPLGRVLPHASSYLPACSNEPPWVSDCSLTTHAYLILLRVEVAAFHRNLIRSSLWPWSSSHDGWSLAITLLCGARTFLPSLAWPATAQPTSGWIMR